MEQFKNYKLYKKDTSKFTDEDYFLEQCFGDYFEEQQQQEKEKLLNDITFNNYINLELLYTINFNINEIKEEVKKINKLNLKNKNTKFGRYL